MSSRHIPRHAWEEKKHIIMALAANNPLKDVVKLMREQHQFNATIVQYEYHLREWRAPPKYLKGDAWVKVIAAYRSLVSQHGTVRVLVSNIPLSTEQLKRKERLYVKKPGLRSRPHPTGGDTSLPDVVSFQRQSADGTWLPLVPGPQSGESDAAPNLEATHMDNAMPAPCLAPDPTGTRVLSLEEEEEEEDISLSIATSPVGVSNPQPLGDSISSRPRASASLVTRTELHEERSRNFCSAILPRSGSPQSLAAVIGVTPFGCREPGLSSHLTFQPPFGLSPPLRGPPSVFAGFDFDAIAELDLSSHLNFRPFLGQSPPPPSPPSRFAGIDVDAIAANWQATAADTLAFEKPTEILVRQLKSIFLNFEKLEIHTNTGGFRPGRTESPFPSTYKGANFHPAEHRHDFGDSVSQQNRHLLQGSPLGTIGFAECLQGNVADTDVPRSVLLALANNFAGLEHVEIGEIIPWISRSKNGSPLIQQLLRDKRNPHVRAIAESLLKASVEAQSVAAFRQIVASGTVDIDAVVFRDGWKRYTVLEMSAALQNLSLVQAILAVRPKIEEPISVLTSDWSEPSGAFACLVEPLTKHDASISSDFEEIAYLLYGAGAYIRPRSLSYLMTKGESGIRLALSLASKLAPTQHEGLISAGFLRYSIEGFQNQDMSLNFIKGIFNICYDEHRWACKHDKAIRSRNEDLIRLLEKSGSLKHLQKGIGFGEAITAASETGNLAYVQKLLHISPRTPLRHIINAVEASIGAGHDEVTSALVAAGSGGDLLIALLRHDWHVILDRRSDPQHPQRCYELLTDWRELRAPWDSFFAHLVGKGDHQMILEAAKLFPVKTSKDTHWGVPWKNMNREVLPLLCEYKLLSERRLTLYLQEALEKGDDSMVDLAIRLGANPVNSRVLELAVIHTPHILPSILSQVPRPVLEFVARGNENYDPTVWTTWRAIQTALSQGLSGLPSLKSLFESGLVRMQTLHILFNSRENGMNYIADLRDAIMAIEGDHDNFAVVRYLVDSGCDPNTHEDARLLSFRGVRSEATALLQAVATKYVGLVELLIQRGANVNQRTTGHIYRTPLQKAAELGSLDIVKLLLDHGANVNAAAAAKPDGEMVRYLVGGWSGATALQLAAISGNCAVACELLERGAYLHMAPCEYKGRWPLEGAAEHGRMSMVELLWEYGSGIFPDSVVDRAMELAEGNGHLACRDLLGSLRAKKRQLGDAASIDWMAPVF
ncbi:hypothetical protein MAPG_02109 [Magnaporthiopsis poae ATCC 64411]|uniref:Clr5 domain-containing protein n=1 Tax=Magnaporthiopsis poae (strain ATCC 64411 / 73-15) TaxID=644358 RepID=A0A0C4DQG9_MAGP6|nr:hypothetical protein MAPG_02109 [Magnaporthiopsis poae ATCC 64411]